MDPLHLIKTAKKLVRGQGGRPPQTDLRRAISTAYYALFHCVANAYADGLIGTHSKTRNNLAWKYSYRSVANSKVAQRCKRIDLMIQLPLAIQEFAELFIRLQSIRHDADYDPDVRFLRSEVIRGITHAEKVINDFKKSELPERKAFAAFVTANFHKS